MHLNVTKRPVGLAKGATQWMTCGGETADFSFYQENSETLSAFKSNTAMKTTKDHDERIANMTFASVYPHYVAKIEKKGRTVEELQQVISWLTGFGEKDVQRLIKNDATFEQFFAEATINPNASLITGSICGYRIEDIETPLTKQVRYLDKLVDELAKGRQMDKILRSP